MKSIKIAAAFAALTLAGAAQAQDMNAYFARQNQQMEEEIARRTGAMVGQNMRDPQVVTMYRQAVAQGYRGSLQQFALGYAQTGGYTERGKQIWAQNEERNHANEVAAQRRLQGAVQDRGRAIAERNGHAAQNIYDGGLSLQNRQRYYDPAAGMQTERSYTAPGDNGYDPRTGRYYRQDARGNYFSCGNDGCVHVGPAR